MLEKIKNTAKAASVAAGIAISPNVADAKALSQAHEQEELVAHVTAEKKLEDMSLSLGEALTSEFQEELEAKDCNKIQVILTKQEKEVLVSVHFGFLGENNKEEVFTIEHSISLTVDTSVASNRYAILALLKAVIGKEFSR